MRNGAMAGSRVLVVEDNFLLAMEIEGLLGRAGCIVLGPVGTIEHRVGCGVRSPPGVAVRDVTCWAGGETPVATVLLARGYHS